MEKTDFSFCDNFSCKEYMDYINNIVFKSKYIPENVYEIEKGGLFGWLETKSSRRNDDADDDDNKRVRICNFFFVVKSMNM